MIRNYNIYVNPTLGSIVSTEGDASFYLGDNNQITVIPDTQEELLISISGNVPGEGTYISELIKDNNNYILKSKDLNGFLVKIGKVNCNIHISNANGERLTTLPFQITSQIAYDREGSTITSPTDVKNLNDFYIALDVIKEMLESGALKGEKGDTGETGPMGPQGPQGEQGPIGPQGPQGPAGKDGTMSFEDLTPEQKASLKGEKGDKGDKGDIGPVGPQGTEGPQGIQGLQGPKGDTGEIGPQGAQGIQGEKGDPGETGPEGPMGPQGPVGPQGIQGETGPQGPAGADGQDYVLTENDKTEIANQVYAMFTNAEEVQY